MNETTAWILVIVPVLCLFIGLAVLMKKIQGMLYRDSVLSLVLAILIMAMTFGFNYGLAYLCGVRF